jgi:hypothetical protein
MPSTKKDPVFEALEVIHGALKPLDPETRTRVLASVLQLLEMKGSIGETLQGAAKTSAVAMPVSSTRPSRPLSLNELIHEKKPGTSAQLIALFAYYRERYESLPRFNRTDLEIYFSRAKEKPPKNYGRDFVEAIKKGWIHEDGDDSYVTSKGIEAVESGFPGERKYMSPGKHIRRRKAKKTK